MEVRNGTLWYIESWSVVDGLAFASERDHDQQAVNTVFLAPPYWSPVAISNIATAWASRRATFQSSFLSPDGETEIAFESLAEIREVLRRAYLAAGYGSFPSGEGGEGGVIVPLPDGNNSGGDWGAIQEWLANVVDADGRKKLTRSLQSFYRTEYSSEHSTGSLVNYFRRHVEVFVERAKRAGKAERHDLASLFRAGSMVFGADNPYFWHLPDRHWSWWLRPTSAASVIPLIFRLPITRHRGRIETLGDHLCLAACSRRYLSRIKEPRDLLPLLLGGLLVCSGNDIDAPHRDRLAGDVIDEACRWLAAGVPSTIGPKHLAAEALEDFIEMIRNKGPAAARAQRKATSAAAR